MISSSGILKRGLAATAISALAVTGLPALAGTAHALPPTGIVVSTEVANRTAFDVDELTGADDDFSAKLTDVNGQPSVGEGVFYSYTFTPDGGAPQPAGPYVAAPGLTDANGEIAIPEPAALAEGSYALTVRGSGPGGVFEFSNVLTFVAGQSEITFADGLTASSPVNGSDVYAATLALTNNAGTPLNGRQVVTTVTAADDAVLSLTQPANTVRTTDFVATSTTTADGAFSVGVSDVADPVPAPPAVPAPQEVDLDAVATGLDVTGLAPAEDAKDHLDITFELAPTVSSITVDTDNVFGGPAAPGKPVELTVEVKGDNGTPANTADDVVLDDFPVNVAVDKGFLTADTEAGANQVDPTELVLDAEQDDAGDLFGFYRSLGTDEAIDTAEAPGGTAGIVAAIAKDAGFNDDGRVAQKVTVTAGGKTVTETINFDSRNHLNMPAAAFRRDGGSPRVPGSIDLKLYAVDQFGNLVGDNDASISDDTPIARVVEEPNGADTDYINDNPAATASSNQPVKQTITAAIAASKVVVNAAGDPVDSNETVNATHVINWGKGGPGGPSAIVAKLTGRNNGGKADKLTVTAPRKAAGAQVKLFKIVRGKQVPAGTKSLRANGKVSFTKADKNGNRFTQYVAKVKKTSDTKGTRTNRRNVR